MSKKMVILISSMVFLGIIVGSFLAYYLLSIKRTPNTMEKQNTEEDVIGGDEDQHGCLIAAGYSWCEQKEKCLRTWEEPCSEEDKIKNINNLIDNITNQTQVDLENTGDVTFDWNYKSDTIIEKITIKGIGFEATGLDDEQYQKVFEFFGDNDFLIDQYNVSAGVVGGSTGFVRNGLYCIESYTTNNYDSENGQITPGADAGKNVQIKCGYPLSTQTQPETNFVEAITQLFADKYQKKLSDISITIAQESEGHARGSVVFQPINEPGNGGWFLAAKINGNWTLVFDGNGIPYCSQIASYNFPEDMIKGYCADQ